MIRLLKFSLLSAVMLSCGLAHAQQPDDPVATRERGMKLYEQGKDDESVKVLQAFVKRYTMDARAWHYLGLARGRQGNKAEARSAHETSARRAVDLTKEYLSGSQPEFLCVMVRPLRTMISEAADSADKYLELSEKPSVSMVEEWRERAEELRRYLKLCPYSSKSGDETSKVGEMVDLPDAKSRSTKARIIKKPFTSYTEEARRNRTSGTVVLFMMLADDGTVKGIVPLVSLPDGLTGEAIKAARQIRFTPATKNGKPVSQFMRVEYNFNNY